MLINVAGNFDSTSDTHNRLYISTDCDIFYKFCYIIIIFLVVGIESVPRAKSSVINIAHKVIIINYREKK